MLNAFTPFPRYENAIFVGDTATEALAQLRIFGRGLIGGDIPSMETLHPAEKMLECTLCAMQSRPQILDSAAKRIKADYVLLEDNGLSELNPVELKEPLEKEGFKVLTLDVKGSPEEVLRRAGALMGEKKQAERIISDIETRLRTLQSLPKLPSLRVLPILGVRHLVENKGFVFAASADSDLSKNILRPLGLTNVVNDGLKEILPGVTDPLTAVGKRLFVIQTQISSRFVAMLRLPTSSISKSSKLLGFLSLQCPFPGTVAAWDAAMREHWKFGTTPFAHFSFNSKTIAIKSNS